MSGSSISTSVEERLFSRAFPFNRGTHSGWIMPRSRAVGDTLAPRMLPVRCERRRSSLSQGGKKDAGRLPPSPCSPKPWRDPRARRVPSWERAPPPSPPPSQHCCRWGWCDRQIPGALAMPDAWHISVAKRGEVLTR